MARPGFDCLLRARARRGRPLRFTEAALAQRFGMRWVPAVLQAVLQFEAIILDT